LSIVSGNGQVIQEQSSTNVTNNPLTVSVKDAQGNPVSASVVTFTVAQGSGFLFPGPQGTSTSSTGSNQITMTTDANGLGSVHFTATAISPGSSYALTTIQASSASQTVTFFVTTALRSVSGGTGAASLPQVTLIKPTLDNLSITGRAGETLPEAIVVRVSVVSGPQAGQPVPNVGVQIKKVEGATGPTGSCAGAGSGGEILTDAAGLATCNLVLGGTLGTGSIQLNVGGYQDIPFQGITLTVTPGVPSEITRRQGDNQSGNPGQTLPLALVGEVKDRFGNLLSGVAVQWQVVSGAAQLTQTVNTTDANGRTSTRVTLGSAPGPTQIRVTAGTVQTTFTVTTNVAVTQLQIVSGSGQQAVTNQAFAQPLVVRVLDANGQPVAGATVTFAASGSVSLGATTAVTNAQGQASINATAGGTPGPIQVTATTPGTSGTLSVTFTLSSRLPGPVFSVANVVNAASNLPGVTPLGLATIYATGIAPNLRGTMMANLLAGPLPLRLADVEVSLGGHQAPILAVANVNNQESVVFQVPGELAAGTTAVTIRTAGGAATTVDGIPVRALQPGIFDTIDAQNRRYAVLIRPDGSFVTPENPARRGEQLRLIATGLGQVTPATGTNRTGIGGQQVIAGVVVGVNDSGVRVISAEYAENLVGAYVVTFEVPADTATGTNRNLGLAVGDPLIFGNGSFIAAIQ
jgi:uncharacterized protein (TIGR03437 family)